MQYVPTPQPASAGNGKHRHGTRMDPMDQITASRMFLPAAGWRNGSSPNNQGTNGNYWSSSLNESNSNNARNLNFNSGDRNVNNNNRYNGQSVRPVTEFASFRSLPFIDQDATDRHDKAADDKLFADLYQAYRDARLRKRNKRSQLLFELNLEDELTKLYHAIRERRYAPGRSICFIIHDPKMREVFAASFRDRVVHHLLYNYLHADFESRFIADSYSCIRGRGTHYGIMRLYDAVRSISRNFSRPCHVLKLDIKGYFMHIDRAILLRLCMEALPDSPSQKYDRSMLEYLLQAIVMHDPVKDCIQIGSTSEWDKLPPSKSLFCSPPGCGLPIGNLTSQLFSNVYLNELDQFLTSRFPDFRYGRYVDDFYVVGSSAEALWPVVREAEDFLAKRLHLELSRRKISMQSAYQGVRFLGTYVKPFRIYADSSSVSRLLRHARSLMALPRESAFCSINSYLGILYHWSTYNIRLHLINRIVPYMFHYGYYTAHIRTYRLKKSMMRNRVDTLNRL